MKILFAAAEAHPLAKVGGLGDVVGSLPKALNELGADARIILPQYKSINLADAGSDPLLEFTMEVLFGSEVFEVAVRKVVLAQSNIIVYFVEQPFYFGSRNIYEDRSSNPGGEFEIEKFLFFSKAITEFLKVSEWQADMLHLHDWHTAITALLLKLTPGLAAMPSVLTIHNLAMQGQAARETILKLGAGVEKVASVEEDLTAFGRLNILRQGIVHSGAVNTVSKSYAKEITTAEFGQGLENELNKHRHLTGIVNGIDLEYWNPSNDIFLRRKYGGSLSGAVAAKAENKKILQESFGLEIDPDMALAGIVSRLTAQKGFDLLSGMAADLEKLNMQLIILGLGEKLIEDSLAKMPQEFPRHFCLLRKFDESLAHNIYAACDLFLMPSFFEPCGLGQMIAMRYGTLPVVRAVGGLKDTVIGLAEDRSNIGTATGFVFDRYQPAELLLSLRQALAVRANHLRIWRQMQGNAMGGDFSWRKSAKEYIELYQYAIDHKN